MFYFLSEIFAARFPAAYKNRKLRFPAWVDRFIFLQ